MACLYTIHLHKDIINNSKLQSSYIFTDNSFTYTFYSYKKSDNLQTLIYI